jgi:hypothetical protein
MTYIIKFDENGNRQETYVKEEMTEERIQELLDEGYIEINEEDYQLLIGNTDGKVYIRKEVDGEVVYEEEPPYVPTQDELDEQEAAAAKNELQTLAINAMMMSLADDDLVETKNTYQTKLRSISDGAALKMTEVFPHWNGNSKEYVVGDKVLYNNVLYKVLQNHTSQEGWTPTSAPSLFAKVLTSEGEILDWEQPSSTNPYMKGDKVKFNGKIYESVIDNNVWSPEAYPQGWKEVEE